MSVKDEVKYLSRCFKPNVSYLKTFQNFQDECEKKLKVLEEADGSAKKMSCHNEADEKVTVLKVSIVMFYLAFPT